ncbi:YchJ family protein [Zooshikella harenae]|uniref:YchJ family protein n=1 Tax=Zooshikella harenae TaxID=2827238 RepID=A0ABS5ZA81_9GAMM|nr:YchJ family protein [Zooshikella harenae]MBU2710963.1 YchJ family protein [Zooshikella harenae]
MSLSTNAPCPCHSGHTYQDCCLRFLNNEQRPETAEQLMRSRYTAYQQQRVDYLVNTTHPDQQPFLKQHEIQQWAQQTDWTGLEIIHCLFGHPTHPYGEVEFIAHYRLKSSQQSDQLHENSTFCRINQKWYYIDPHTVPSIKVKKLSRNDICLCGSGKKYKKCCMRS